MYSPFDVFPRKQRSRRKFYHKPREPRNYFRTLDRVFFNSFCGFAQTFAKWDDAEISFAKVR